MIASELDGIGFEYVERVKRLGFDYVELPLAEMSVLSNADFFKIKSLLNALELPCETCNNFFPKTMRLTGDSIDEDAITDYMERMLSRAGELGAEIVVFGSGAAKRVPNGFPKSLAFTQLKALLDKMSVIALKTGITIVIEPSNRDDCNIINTFSEGVDLVSLAGRENIKVLIDYFHATLENDDVAIINQHKGYLQHIHFSCPRDDARGIRVPPSLNDGWDYSVFVSVIKESGYEKRITLEAYMTDFIRESNDALHFMKEKFV
jgi:sugar phosphate isomerase/epimerase